MWQKARFLKTGIYPDLAGREIWTRGAPNQEDTVSMHTGFLLERASRIEVAIIPILNTPRMVINIAALELLPEFAEDVKMVEWEDFLAGKEA